MAQNGFSEMSQGKLNNIPPQADGSPHQGRKKRTVEQKRGRRDSWRRLTFVAIAMILEFVWIFWMANKINTSSEIISLLTRAFALFLVVYIYDGRQNAAIKMPWILLIMALPLLGVMLYLMVGLSGTTKNMRARFRQIDDILFPFLKQDEQTMQRIEEENPGVASQMKYLLRNAGYPVYDDTDIVYYADASEGLEAQKKALTRAKKSIYMEYFAIEDAEAFAGIFEILRRKAQEGLDVRVFYDDVGSIGFLNKEFIRKMERAGIACRVFNPMSPVLNAFLDNRDHRKMTIIDGRVGFTGGYNLANEYFNITHPYGEWKDTGVRLVGGAVRSMTVTFLEMWNAIRPNDRDDAHPEELIHPVHHNLREAGTYVQFYADNPIDEEHVGENVYLNAINNAKNYCYIMTPYLIITDEMKRALTLAARRGVDVRIVTPGIPDKKVVYQITRSYYYGLVSKGVRIYEYTPGFCHAKMCVADDEIATCGTINLDYRSLYHHFEDGCLMYNCMAVIRIRQDFERSFRRSKEVTEQYRVGRTRRMRMGQAVLRLFAPLL